MNYDPDRIIRVKAVLARTGLSRSTLYRKMYEGTFPAGLKIATRCVGWRESDIDSWVARSGSGSSSLTMVKEKLDQLRSDSS